MSLCGGDDNSTQVESFESQEFHAWGRNESDTEIGMPQVEFIIIELRKSQGHYIWELGILRHNMFRT